MYAGHDRYELLDSDKTIDVLGPACRRMQERMMRISAQDLPSLERIERENAAIDAMVSELLAQRDVLDDDKPLGSWLEDWARLVRARQDFVETGDFEMPRDDDGLPLVTRMNELVEFDLPECRVPASLIPTD